MKNSLEQYSNCQFELYGRSTLVVDQGFIVYKAFEDGSIYIHLLYVEPEFRAMGVGGELANKLMEHTGSNTAYSYVDITTKDPEIALLAQLRYGFRIHSISGNNINLVYTINQREKEIK